MERGSSPSASPASPAAGAAAGALPSARPFRGRLVLFGGGGHAKVVVDAAVAAGGTITGCHDDRRGEPVPWMPPIAGGRGGGPAGAVSAEAIPVATSFGIPHRGSIADWRPSADQHGLLRRAVGSIELPGHTAIVGISGSGPNEAEVERLFIAVGDNTVRRRLAMELARQLADDAPVHGPTSDTDQTEEAASGTGASGDGPDGPWLSPLDRERLSVLLAAVLAPSAEVSRFAQVSAGALIAPRAVVNADAVIGLGAIINTAAIIEHDCRIGDFAHIAPGVVLGGTVTVGEAALVGLGARVCPGVTIGRGARIGAGAVVIADVPDDALAVGVPARVIDRLTD